VDLPEPTRTFREDPPPGGGVPSWLVALLSLAAVAGLGWGVVYFLREQKAATAASAEAAAETAPAADPAGGKPHPLTRFVEVTGLRVWADGKKPVLKFMVVNHSVGPLGGFDLDVDVHVTSAKPGDAPLMSLTTPVRNIGPMESRDFTVPLSTKLNAIDVPDWQFLRASFRIKNAD